MRKFPFNIRIREDKGVSALKKWRNFKVTKRQYTLGFFSCVALLALVRCAFPGVAEPKEEKVVVADSLGVDSLAVLAHAPLPMSAVQSDGKSRFFNADGTVAKHRIWSVPHFGNTFPDQNDVQLLAASRWGVEPVKDRAEAEHRMSELVYIESNPFFHVDKLTSSIPYLVPRASVLLQDIGRAFFDSLQIKGVPLHQVIVTSVLRSKDDVAKLQGRNLNAKENSCHLYGTTFDICYNRYKTVEPPGEKRREVRNDTLKWILSEVLQDFREQRRCYVKYEVKQGCFHITVN